MVARWWCVLASVTGNVVCRVVKLWKEEVAKTSQKASDALADPEGYENLFPNFKDTLQAEQVRTAAVAPRVLGEVHVVLLSVAGCTVRSEEAAPHARIPCS